MPLVCLGTANHRPAGIRPAFLKLSCCSWVRAFQYHRWSRKVFAGIFLPKHSEEAFIKKGLHLVNLMESKRHIDCIHSCWPLFRCFRNMNWHGWWNRTRGCHQGDCGGRRERGKRQAKRSSGCACGIGTLALRGLGVDIHIFLRGSFYFIFYFYFFILLCGEPYGREYMSSDDLSIKYVSKCSETDLQPCNQGCKALGKVQWGPEDRKY